jgi:hypothetical protein
MDFAFARGRHAAVLAVVLVACSSSSSNGGSSGDGDGGPIVPGPDAASEGGSSGAGSSDAAADYDAAIAACASYSIQMQRVACCEQQIPGGYLTQQLAEQTCLCGSNGPCTSVCDSADCFSLQGSTGTCQSCLDTNLAGSCKGTIAAACAADPGCVAYEACVQGGSP